MRRFTFPAFMLVLLFTCFLQLTVHTQILYKVNFHDKNNYFDILLII